MPRGGESVGQLAQVTNTIPIIFAAISDPIVLGFANSLQRPGKNITGIISMSRDLGGKRLQLLKEAFPRVAHVAVLFAPIEASGPLQFKEISDAGVRLKVRVTPVEVRQATEIEPAFKRAASLGARAYMVTAGFLLAEQRAAIIGGIARSKAPAMLAGSQYVEAGGLMSYAPNTDDNSRRAAAYVDKILKGAKPGDLPIEQPTKFELVVNMKTAKAMGFTFPQSFLLQVDRAIE